MTDYHFGPLLRFIPNALGTAMARIVSGVNRVFARNLPVEFVADNPAKLSADRWWYVGQTEIIAYNTSTHVLTARSKSFELSGNLTDVRVAHLYGNLLFVCSVYATSTWVVGVIDLTAAASYNPAQPATDRVQVVAIIDKTASTLTKKYFNQETGDLWTDTSLIALTALAESWMALPMPAFNNDCTELHCGYVNSTTWMADAITVSLQALPINAETLAILRENPTYPANLTQNVTVTGIAVAAWNGNKTVYGPTALPAVLTNSPGNLLTPTGYLVKFRSTNVGEPIGPYTYSGPYSQEYCEDATGKIIYPMTLEDWYAEWQRQHEDHTNITITTGPTAFSNTLYESVPAGWSDAFNYRQRIMSFVAINVNDSTDILEVDLTSNRVAYQFTYSVQPNTGMPTYYYPDGTTGISGKLLKGWVLNPTTSLVEELWEEETAGQVTTASASGSRPVMGPLLSPGISAFSSYFGASFPAVYKAAMLADAMAAAPCHGALSGGNYSYHSELISPRKVGFYIGGRLQYETYNTSGSRYVTRSQSVDYTGASYSAPQEFNDSMKQVLTLGSNTTVNNFRIGVKDWFQRNEQAGVAALLEITWGQNKTASQGPATHTVIASKNAIETIIGETVDLDWELSGTAAYIVPLNLIGDCLMNLHSDEIQKLFTSSGDNITAVDFGGGAVDISTLTASADFVVLFVVA